MIPVENMVSHKGTVSIYDATVTNINGTKGIGKYFIVEFIADRMRIEGMYLQKDEDIKTLIKTIEVPVKYNRAYEGQEIYNHIRLIGEDQIINSCGQGDDRIEVYLTPENSEYGRYLIKQNRGPKMYISSDETLDNLYTCLKAITMSEGIKEESVITKVYDRFEDLDYGV